MSIRGGEELVGESLMLSDVEEAGSSGGNWLPRTSSFTFWITTVGVTGTGAEGWWNCGVFVGTGACCTGVLGWLIDGGEDSLILRR